MRHRHKPFLLSTFWSDYGLLLELHSLDQAACSYALLWSYQASLDVGCHNDLTVPCLFCMLSHHSWMGNGSFWWRCCCPLCHGQIWGAPSGHASAYSSCCIQDVDTENPPEMIASENENCMCVASLPQYYYASRWLCVLFSYQFTFWLVFSNSRSPSAAVAASTTSILQVKLNTRTDCPAYTVSSPAKSELLNYEEARL